ncbi:hypothetical protein AgCh_011914 [Apium graveolens]
MEGKIRLKLGRRDPYKVDWAKFCTLVSLQSYTKALTAIQRSLLVEKSRQKTQEKMNILTEIDTCNGFYCDGFFQKKSYKPKMWTEVWISCIMEELILAGNLRVGSLPLAMTMMLLLMNTDSSNVGTSILRSTFTGKSLREARFNNSCINNYYSNFKIVAEVDEEKSNMDRWKGLAFDISDDQQDITRGKGIVDSLFQAPMNSGTHNGAPMITSVSDSPIRVPAEPFLTLSAFDAPPIVIALAAIYRRLSKRMDAMYESQSRFPQELTHVLGTAFRGLGADIQWPIFGEDSTYPPPDTSPSEGDDDDSSE